MEHTIIDFHAHPFWHSENNYCHYKEGYPLDPAGERAHLEGLGIGAVCGSILGRAACWEDIVRLNDRALELRDRWGGFYIPGFHIHPDHMAASLEEIRRMAGHGVRLVGELVPYMHRWDLSRAQLDPLLEAIEEEKMVFSYHSLGGVEDTVLEPMLERFPKVSFVAAHPGEKKSVSAHVARMERYGNYFIDLSGNGFARMGMLRWAIDRVGKERFLFGTDFPICPPEVYVAGVAGDPLLTAEEKQAIFHDNAHRLLFGPPV